MLYFRYESAQQELQEHTLCSEELEKELESQVKELEFEVSKYKKQNITLTFDYETLKVFYFLLIM